MIHTKSIVFVAAFAAFAAASAPAQVVSPTEVSPTTKIVHRSGEVITCHPGADCTEETVDGRVFYVMQTPDMEVKVAEDPDAKYSHITVFIENRADIRIQIIPAAFRIETTKPKFRRFSFIEPRMLKLAVTKAPRLEKTAMRGASFVSTSQESEQDRRMFMLPSPLFPSGTTIGDVYFERAAGDSTMSLLLPISGWVFEFPFTPSK